MIRFLVFLSVVLAASTGKAWGKRGHALICETAAYLASSQKENVPDGDFLRKHSFDLAFYCNVPDLIWKRPKTYGKESKNHFMNLESFEEEIPKQGWQGRKSPFRLSRKEFAKKYKKLPKNKGRSWWRIQELQKDLQKVTDQLKNEKLTRKKRQALQTQWLTVAGVLGHYVADLAMPLHVSSNYDGELTGQKGLHHFFEEKMVRHLFLTPNPGLQGEVYKRAVQEWPSFVKASQDKDFLDLAIELSLNSQSRVPHLLEVDRKTGRNDLAKAMTAHQELVIERLVKGSLYQALVYARHLGWNYDGKKYYEFNENPSFVEPPK